ncbi:MAG: biotin-dependent carboxyltransferase family protein [Marmoricola sp.]
MTSALTVLDPGPLTTVQDAGLPGLAALGVPHSGACDRRSHRLANRLVGNAEEAAVLEATLGGLVARAERDLLVVTTGARCAGPWPHNAATVLRSGQEIRLGPPASGLRTYLAVRGGLAIEPVLGSRSTDLLSGIGPEPLRPGDTLAVGIPAGSAPDVDVAPVPEPAAGEVTVEIGVGPRRDWFDDAAWQRLTTQSWTVSNDSNRIGLRLQGRPLDRVRTDELPSEGLVRGALQVPPSGEPVLFLADHPVTGGYPVIGYVADADVDACGQLRPGQPVRLRPRPAARQ